MTSYSPEYLRAQAAGPEALAAYLQSEQQRISALPPRATTSTIEPAMQQQYFSQALGGAGSGALSPTLGLGGSLSSQPAPQPSMITPDAGSVMRTAPSPTGAPQPAPIDPTMVKSMAPAGMPAVPSPRRIPRAFPGGGNTGGVFPGRRPSAFPGGGRVPSWVTGPSMFEAPWRSGGGMPPLGGTASHLAGAPKSIGGMSPLGGTAPHLTGMQQPKASGGAPNMSDAKFGKRSRLPAATAGAQFGGRGY